mmetsp:Transcript_127302/g.254322  ORF Transcript_127302/g.254322 Transcript_127302/m.254322 type:complete len:116 (+) Transcript_127302:42-389(+)|eukprot:CAMPEP_0172662134 /NCGR_PEP_ID=MMETSP1074-20121228/5171_1 /TAXON_ID=2916 /ORGANISM="Ceratium fusus, Strain PA161109" /LENGTH=115 /DNA_ID=CAMNT_0013478005 /DNA_START=43 /DNA_END=390 /DNA_ORIENTATION=-
MSTSTPCGLEGSVHIIGISGDLCCVSAKSTWHIGKLRHVVARALAAHATELILLDGETELEDHNTVGKRRQLTAFRVSPAVKQRKANEHIECMGALVLQRAKLFASQNAGLQAKS